MAGQILIVEDEPHTRELLEEFFSFQGYSVLTAKDGYEAANAIKQQIFDLVCLDLRLPGLHSLEILRKIKETSPEIPIVVISGYLEDMLEINNKDMYPDMVIPKLFKLSQLREALTLIKKRAV